MCDEKKVKLKGIKAIMFDFDGTLIDTMKGFANIAASVMEKNYGVPLNYGKRLYIETSGIPFFEQLEILFPNDKRNSTSAKEFERKKIEGFFKEKIPEETKETIRYLKKTGKYVAVSSNNFQNLVKNFIFRENGNGVKFDFILGFRKNFFKGKPHFDYVLKKTNLKNFEILFVGDSFKDAEKAFDNEINFIGKIGTFKREEFENNFPSILLIENIEELKEIVE